MLYVAPDVVVPFYRGASTHVLEVARALARQGDNVHVLSRRLNSSQPAVESINGVTVHRVYRGMVGPLPGSEYSELGRGHDEKESLSRSLYRAYLSTLFPLFAGWVSAGLIRKYGVDVILERETAFGAGAVASETTGVPLVLEVVGPRFSKKSVATAKRVMAYTAAMVRGVDQSRVEFVDAGVDSDAFFPDPTMREATRARLGLDSHCPLIGYAGTFQTWHGLDSLLTALKGLVPRFPDLRALFVGPYFGEIQRQAESLGLARTCIFTGPVPYEAVAGYINACDVMVAPYDPSRSRLRSSGGIGFPLKVLEYMACAKPVVTSDISPTNQIPRIDTAAALVPPGRPDALVDELSRLIADPVLAKSFGENGRMLVEEGHSWTVFARNLHAILEEARKES